MQHPSSLGIVSDYIAANFVVICFLPFKVLYI